MKTTAILLLALSGVWAPTSSAALFDITVTASQTPHAVNPGASGQTLMWVQILNDNLPFTSRTLQSIRFTNTTSGPGTLAARDAELGTLRLYRDDGDGVFDLPGDVLLAPLSGAPAITAQSGKITFSGLTVSCLAGAGNETRLLVVSDLPLAVRDGDVLDVTIQSSADLTFNQSVPYANTFPVSPAGNFPIDGMVAPQVTVISTGSASLLAGTDDNLVMHLVLPANGYEADVLENLAVVNAGTAVAGPDIAALRLWADTGNGSFDPAQDRLVGDLTFTGGQWQISGRSEPVPLSGLRVFISADISNSATEGRTVRLALPGPGVAVGMRSGNDGPLDHAVEAPIDRAVSTADRVTLVAATIAPTAVRPGDAGVPLLQVAASNSYTTAITLDRLSITNAGVGGAIADRDRAIQTLTLRRDGNGDGVLGDSLTDPPIATGFFTGGSADFASLAQSLPAGSTRHFFVTATVGLIAADGAVLSARIDSPTDVDLGDTTRVVASWPLDSRAAAIVNGMVAAQLTSAATPPLTLAPDDANVLALDVLVPRNGHLDDVLESLRIVNLGNATDAEIAELRWWRDGGDGAFTPTLGDDRDLGVAVWDGAGWSGPPLTEPLGAAGARLFAVLRVTSSPRDSATVRMAVPLGGITVTSGNDGPLDQAVPNPTTVLISNSALLASLEIAPPASTTGQAVSVSMAVRNVGTGAINGVSASPLTASGSGSLTLQSGPTPDSLSLAPGAADTIRWTYVAANPGGVRLGGYASGRPASGGSVRSLDVSSDPHQVFAQVSNLDLEVLPSLPPTVNRGQTGVTPMTLRFTNGGAQASPVRLTALRIGLEDESGAGVVPNQLLSRVTVNQGTTVRLSRTSLESAGSEVDLTLAAPAVINGGETIDLTLGLDVHPGTSVPSFRVVLANGSWVTAEDANTGAPVLTQLSSGAFPVRTGLARVVEAPTRLDIVALAAPTANVGPGQADVPLLAMRLTSPGATGITNDVRVTSIAIAIEDTLGVQAARLSDALSWIRVRNQFQTLASRAVFASDGGLLTLLLSPGLSIPVNVPVDLFLSGDISSAAASGAFRLRLQDSTRVDARDAGTSSRVAVMMTSDPLPGRTVVVQGRAETLLVSSTARMPATAAAGDAGVHAMSIRLWHPGSAGGAGIRLDSLVVRSRDPSHRPLAPSLYMSRLRLLWAGVEAGRRDDPPSTGESTGIPAGGRTLAPGDSVTVDLLVDFAATAPPASLELSILAGGVFAADANLGAAIAVAPAGEPFPLFSGPVAIQAPPRTLVVAGASAMPPALAADGREVAALVLQLGNPAAGSGDIRIDRLVLRATDRAHAAIPLGALVERLVAKIGGVPWAQSASLSPDSVSATLAAAPLTISPGAPVTVDVVLVPRAGVTRGTLRLALDAAGVGVIQPGSSLLQIQVQAAPGQTFPLASEAGSFGAPDLASSYSNFPNPFAAGREPTRFAYYLAGAGRTWLRVFTLAGEPVATLVDGQARAAGLHQYDYWTGRNGIGLVVRNGVYVAELTVHYDDGTQARVMRKVAVVR